METTRVHNLKIGVQARVDESAGTGDVSFSAPVISSLVPFTDTFIGKNCVITAPQERFQCFALIIECIPNTPVCDYLLGEDTYRMYLFKGIIESSDRYYKRRESIDEITRRLR